MVKILTGRIAVPIAAALALLATPLMAGAAPGPLSSGPEIDSSAQGSLTIVKLGSRAELPQGTPKGTKASGLELQGLSTNPDEVFRIPGVRFSIKRLTGYDLSTAQDWEAAQTLTGTADPNDLKGLAGSVVQTGCTGWASYTGEAAATHVHNCVGISSTLPDPASTPDGELRFPELDVGLYVVSEEGTPDNVIPAVPFLVSIPMPHPTDSAKWLYDVTVYPKNAIAGVTKTVEDDGLVLGDHENDVTYTVTMPVPEGTSRLEITDTLDERLGLTFDQDHFRIQDHEDAVWIATSSSDPKSATIAPGVFVEYGTINGTPGTLRVTYTDPAVAETTVGFEFDASIDRTKMIQNPVISNKARYKVTVAGGTSEGESTVETKWGGIKVLKTTNGDVPLEGALFNVAASPDHVENGPYLFDEDVQSNENGILTFEGLRYSEWKDGELVSEPQIYYLVETSAPAGYVRNTTAVEFMVVGTSAEAKFIEVDNDRQAGFELPTIGGSRAVLPILGGLVVVGGVVWLVRSRRVSD